MTRNQQSNESVESYITAIRTAANQIQFKDEQQLGYCIIRGLRPSLRLHVLQNDHDTLDKITHHARVAEVAAVGAADNDKAISDLTQSVTLLVEKLTSKDAATFSSTRPPTVAAVDNIRNDYMRDSANTNYRSRHPFQSGQIQQSTTYGRSGIRPPGSPTSYRRQPQQNNTNNGFYHGQQPTDNIPRQRCGNCLLTHAARQCPAYSCICYNCNRRNHFARACRSRPQPQVRFNLP